MVLSLKEGIKMRLKRILIFIALFIFIFNIPSFNNNLSDRKIFGMSAFANPEKQDKYVKYNNSIKLKEISTKENKEKGQYALYGDVLKLSENIAPETFSDFTSQFKPFKKDGAILKFIDINSNESKEGNINSSPFIKYFKVENTKTGYIREDLYICTNHKEAVNYTLSNDTKRKWIKEILKRDCMEE